MIGEKIDERRLFSPEERRQILKDNYGICACCGKKLTTKTLRIEHIIPLSRGGKNEPANLTALCEECNKWKDNKIYMPCDFYSAIRDKPRIHEMEQYVREWFQSVKDEFDLERFPMISFNIFIQLDPVFNAIRKKAPAFNRQLLFKWSLGGEFRYREIERLTGQSVSDIRDYVRSIKCGNHKMAKNHPVPLYCVEKVTTGNILAVLAVSYWKGHGLVIYIPWHRMGKAFARSMVYNFVLNILTSLDEIAGERIQHYMICSEHEETLSAFQIKDDMPNIIGSEARFGYYENEEGKRLYVTEVSRIPRIVRDLRLDYKGKGK